MKVTVKVWDPLNDEEEDAQEVAFEVGCETFDATNYALQQAAAEFVEKHWSDWDYPACVTLHIRTPWCSLLEIEVHAEQSVDFRAYAAT